MPTTLPPLLASSKYGGIKPIISIDVANDPIRVTGHSRPRS